MGDTNRLHCHTMSISTVSDALFARNFGRAIAYNLNKINLAPVKQIKVTFDPFGPKVKSAREFAFAVTGKRRKKTNPECVVKLEVKNDRTEPIMEVKFNNGKNAVFKTQNLMTMDIIKEFNKLCEKNMPEAETQT